MTDIDQFVRESLMSAADDGVHVERLLADVRAGGLRYRRRNRLMTAAAAAAAVLALVGVTAVVLRPEAQPPITTPPTTAPPVGGGGSDLPTPPVVPDGVSPLRDPSVIGRPGLLHIGVVGLRFDYRSVFYDQSANHESVQLNGLDITKPVTILLGRADPQTSAEGRISSDDVTVDGRPGRFTRWGGTSAGFSALSYTPVDGLWLTVSGMFDEAGARQAAATVRLGTTYRCGRPFRLPAPPAALRWTGCGMTFNDGQVTSMTAEATIGDDLVLFNIGEGIAAFELPPSPGTTTEKTLGGRTVTESTDGHKVSFVSDQTRWSVQAPDRATAESMAATVQLGGVDPAKWLE